MVTDSVAAEEPATPAAGMSYGARLAVTVLLLGLYVLGHKVPIPLVDPELFSYTKTPLLSNILVLSFTPLITGFLLVELFAVATTPGRRLRKDAAGRAKLNRAALVLSLLTTAYQAMGMAKVMVSLTSPTGMPFVTRPGPVFSILLVMTLAAVTASLFLLGNLISEYGVGNGFCLLMITQAGWALWGSLSSSLGGPAVAVGSPVSGFGILLVGILAGVVIRQFQAARAAKVPAFPQGIVPAVLAGTILSLLLTLPWVLDSLPASRSVAEPVFMLVAVLLLSLLTFHLFSSRQRLEANLSEPEEVLDGIASAISRRLPASIALLAVGTAGWLAWSWYRPSPFFLTIGFVQLVFVIAVAFDLRDQFLFLQRNGSTARLIQLDNVHFSYRLVERLEEEGIDALARAQHFRSLYFFFGPLVKIDVLVPRDQLDEAQAVLAELESAREIKVF